MPNVPGWPEQPSSAHAPGRYATLSLRDGDLVERLAVAERNLAEGAAEGTVELEHDHLVDEQAAVAGDLDRDVRRGQGERLRGGVPGERERRQQRRPLERDAWRLPGLVLDLEEVLLREPERPGEEHARHRLDRGVVGEDGVVVDLARDRDPVLRLRELLLQLPEVLVRLQLGVRLRDGEEPAERLAEDALGGALLGRPLRGLRAASARP